ncbi:hypothetical protein DPEC_G00188650 [Dallia pectoralis]|uniref:Uncharacterized protein n=1 Tax=Dallia pectoralis TaxID=75939 RepID=A0ACC2GBT1_DALPE|nr:hypothetical protein DPEC_G00188650 [Dallia pectoralis]
MEKLNKYQNDDKKEKNDLKNENTYLWMENDNTDIIWNEKDDQPNHADLKTHGITDFLWRTVFDSIRRHAVDVTLDPDTANPHLILTEDGKQVRFGDIELDLPDNPERFNYCPNVLGKEGFSSGRFYYEIRVKGNTEWIVGVAIPTLLSLREKPQKVGVFVDYEEGQVSFFIVETRSHICSFTGQDFTDKLYPFFSLGYDLFPLVICPLDVTD